MKKRTQIRARAKAAAQCERTLANFNPDSVSATVFRKDQMMALYGRQVVAEFIVMVADGFVFEFDTELDATCFQRDFLKEFGLDVNCREIA